MSEPLLSIRDLSVDYVTDTGPVRAVDRVSLAVERGEIVGLAGESGSGKTTLAQVLLRILPPPAVVTGGEVRSRVATSSRSPRRNSARSAGSGSRWSSRARWTRSTR